MPFGSSPSYNNWLHATLSVTNADHFVPGGTMVLEVGTSLPGAATSGVPFGVGAFVYRETDGSGTVNLTGVRLQWNYGVDGVLDAALITIDVNAIEMVYVPQGSFYVGDGSGNNGTLRDANDDSSPVLISGPGPTLVSTNTPGTINVPSSSYLDFPAAFPNGYEAFYCMKYPMTQGQAIDAVNKLPGVLGFEDNGPSSRQDFTGGAPNLIAVTPDRAFVAYEVFEGFPYFDELGRYLDYMGLRPMTDLEYEKACRGPIFPVPDERAWGTAVQATLPYSLSDDGTADEAVSVNYNENAGNLWETTTDPGNGSDSADGPCRVGMFAKGSYNGGTSGRIQSGATYYGIMNMSGNVGEYVIEAEISTSSLKNLYAGSHGDGTATSSTTDLPADWADSDHDYRTKGGSYGTSLSEGISGRNNFINELGIRGVRTAP